MPAPLTPNITAAVQTAIIQELSTFFNEMQIKAILKTLDNVVESISSDIEALDGRVEILEGAE